ncbi:coiled-coil domain-containing protein 30 [Seriola aureovittata]|uniref:coiled-coil domain-containing protein 30 n=1 Tax=Seriola aureovittata TaxID=2871759 RepID=UPI0024BE8711|nr:coiled-coil domain-containing protein 30 [Seriola aureovittata]
MAQPEEDLEQIATWFSEEGLASDSPKEAQLCLLWRALQRTKSSLTRDQDKQRSQHLAEMAEVRKSFEQIRIFTEQKDVLAQEIQDENDQLKDQLRQLISLQDTQISEVAKMLYQQGLTELIHSSPSEQVAYLLVERASLLETSEDPFNLMGAGNTMSPLQTETQVMNSNARQYPHKGAPRHGQSPWRRLFGLHKASQSKHTFIPAEARHLTGQSNSVERKCSRLERDLEEGSRRLAMAHNEIRRLTDELESAHLTQKTYEPELQAAQQEVENLKKYEMVELRKTKELNDRLDLEIRALRSRVRSLDAEKSSLQQTVVSLREEMEQVQSALQQQQLLTVQVQADRTTELAKVVCLQKEVERLESALQEQHQQAEQQLQTVQFQAAEMAQSNTTCRNLKEKQAAQTRCLLDMEQTVVSLQKEVERLESALQQQQQQLQTVQGQAQQANELAKSQESELNQSNQVCRALQNTLSAQTRKSLLEEESEHLDNSHGDLDNAIATICKKDRNPQDQKPWKQKEVDMQHGENTHWQLEDSYTAEDKEPQSQLCKENKLHMECPDHQNADRNLLSTQDECETLKKEICETLKCLDKERSKYYDMKEKHKAKLFWAKQKYDDETMWRDEKIKSIERELSLCSHSLAKEKELVASITAENEKLLVERTRLLQQLNEEEHNKKDSNLTAALSKCRVDFLEMENKKLGNKILHMSNQLAVLERTLQNMQSLHFAEELKKIYNPQQIRTSHSVQTSSVMMPKPSEIQTLWDDTQSGHAKQPRVTSSPNCLISAALSRSAEMGYLNLTSAQNRSDQSASPAVLSSSESSGS